MISTLTDRQVLKWLCEWKPFKISEKNLLGGVALLYLYECTGVHLRKIDDSRLNRQSEKQSCSIGDPPFIIIQKKH